MTNVAKTMPFSPTICVKSAVIKEVARILTKLLPKRTEPIKRSLSLVTFKALAAPSEPLSACACSLLREAAVKAVSEPEKKLDRISRTKIAPKVIQKPESKLKFSITDLFSVVAPKDDAPAPARATVLLGYACKSLLSQYLHGLKAFELLLNPRHRPVNGWQMHVAEYAA